jgi:hypothetical protein
VDYFKYVPVGEIGLIGVDVFRPVVRILRHANNFGGRIIRFVRVNGYASCQWKYLTVD